MGIAVGMNSLTKDILFSYDARVKAVNDLVGATHKTLKGFASDRKQMSAEQAESLGNFAKDLAKKAGDILKGFKKNRKQMSEEQAKGLTDFTKTLTKDMDSMLHSFTKNRQKMSAELEDKLSKDMKDMQTAVKNIVSNAQTLIGEYRSDMQKAKHAWQKMEATKAGKEGLMPRIEASEKVTTVEDAVGKKRGAKKRGRKS